MRIPANIAHTSVVGTLLRVTVAASTLALAACGSNAGIPGLGSGEPGSAPAGTEQAAAAGGGQTIGSGPVRVALLLPFSSQGGAGTAQAMRNAAEMAMSEFNGQELTVLVKDEGATPEAAAAATKAAIAEGAELIIGPLFSGSVAAAGPVAKAANRPMIAFSSDEGVAQSGVYLLSFAPQADVARVVNFAASKGKRRFAMLAPNDAYGNVTAQAFAAAVGNVDGAQLVFQERYAAGGLAQAVTASASQLAGADALFIPDRGGQLVAAAPALAATRVQLLGTGQWADANVYAVPQLAGAWYAAPESASFAAFSKRYQEKFGSPPVRNATLAYDAVALANVLTRTQGANRFNASIFSSPSGFGGQDGVFRFRANGTSERALAIYQIGEGAAQVVAPAPRSFARSGT
jgi:branched-chain amino acid transport system substrate-binding protein